MKSHDIETALQHYREARYSDAKAVCQQIIAKNADDAQALHLLGAVVLQEGDPRQATDYIRRALVADANLAIAHNSLGYALLLLGKVDEATASCRRALQLNPTLAEAHLNLGNALTLQNRLDEAIESFCRALKYKPNHAEGHHNLANVLADSGRIDEAIEHYRSAITLNPGFALACNNLGSVYAEVGKLDEAIYWFKRALTLQPDLAEAHHHLGNTLKDQGQIDAAIAAYRESLRYQPDDKVAHSNLIYAMQFSTGHDPATILEEQRRWQSRHVAGLVAQTQHANDRDPNRRLKIGYVSPDFYAQAEAAFVVPLLEAHDHRNFEIHCYASVRRPDFITERLKEVADFWHNSLNVTDERLADQIRMDNIDILVDLTMHMADNRLPVFARKPAPVQVTWLAYPGGTGLDAIDYRLTDNVLDPPQSDDGAYAEKSVRLESCWCCYDPLTDRPNVNALPALTRGQITFGCLNNFCKINEEVLDLWAKVLLAISGSHLFLLAKEGSHRQRTLTQLENEGVAPNRIHFFGRLPHLQYLELYHQIDIALDPFPYNSITTACDALWMGVPLLTFRGPVPQSRAAMSLLHAAGLPEFVSEPGHKYIELVQATAGDLNRLSTIRSALRTKVQTSALMDRNSFARVVEEKYRWMWQRWSQS